MDDDGLTTYDAADVIARHLIARGADRLVIAATLRNAAEQNRRTGCDETAEELERVVREIIAPK